MFVANTAAEDELADVEEKAAAAAEDELADVEEEACAEDELLELDENSPTLGFFGPADSLAYCCF